MSIKLVEEIAKRLKASRKAAGYKSAKDFAISQNMPLSTYSQHETGKRSINAELIITYSSKLEINPYWLLTGKGDPYFGTIGPEKRAIIEQENYSITKESAKESDKYRQIDLDLLKKVLFAAEQLFNDKSVKLSYQELINYCFEVYDIVSTLTVDTMEKEKIINLTISSLKRGTIKNIESQKDRFAN
jgi:transcriptional regulator with XRE-family HTH domain